MAYALVLNSGSSSIKFQIVDPTASASDQPFVTGLVERIGEPNGRISIQIEGRHVESNMPIRDHRGGLMLAIAMLDANGAGPTQVDIIACGHRVVHGGQTFSAPVLVNDNVIELIRELIPLAPLHNPANIDGIEVARDLLPDVPHVAVFDTAFFTDLPAYSANYALNAAVAKEHNIRRYGAHGTSHEFIALEVADFLGQPIEDLNQIVMHIGNGASASAIRGGHPIDTSMGLTPLEGLVMGTRSGDIDPGVIFHLARNADMNIDEIDDLLNRRSGVKGLSGVNDFRVLHDKMDEGDENAKLAYDVYIHRLRRYIGAYMITLGRVDTITFTAGVGENDHTVRTNSLAGLENYGIKIDEEKNQNGSGPRIISTDDSTVKVLVVPTNEELAIAQKSAAIAESL
ncbi:MULTISPECIES: acetate kinase [unclassified Corynebacterium]|uniref:acetate kinase n=1 Tax=unclassified Corynebacterium TaxID=2624378 RepID=UPI002651B217|nr:MULTISPECIES: acetate kinase [unclassified Corynebacterium]MDN8595245.1 acetate kinase [Corynebacterium sp. P4_F2]WKK55371.1 acetate kinase [Corynebacterium sp. P4-C1]WKK62780.1 acetate kinase [Corynebacterium sp. P8-C1]